MTENLFVIVVAGGSGQRMGGDIPKQFLPLRGVPILRMTIDKIRHACPKAQIVTVLPKNSMEYWKGYCLEHFSNCPQMLVEGGLTRFHSVRNALERIPDDAIVAVHDGVRPLFSEGWFRNMFSEMSHHRALIPVIPMVDTLKVLKKNEEGKLEIVPDQTADRSLIYGAQTPQFFHAGDLKDAYSQAYDVNFTDDASVVQKKNIPLSYFPGERFNIKITTPQDLKIAEIYLSVEDSDVE